MACILDKSNQSSSPSPPSDTTVPVGVGVAVGVVLVVVVVVVVVVVCCRRRINNRKQLESSRAFSYVVNLFAFSVVHLYFNLVVRIYLLFYGN